MAAQVKQRPPPRGSRFVQRVGPLAVDLRWVMAAVAPLFVASLAAFIQDVRPDPFRAPPALSLDWWRYPIELGAYKRWPIVTGDIRGLAVTGEPRRVWAVGQGGLILSSDDDGESWTQHRIELGDARPLPGGDAGAARQATTDATAADRQRLGELDARLAALVPDEKMRAELIGVPKDMQEKLLYSLGKVDTASVRAVLQERATLGAKLAQAPAATPAPSPHRQQAFVEPAGAVQDHLTRTLNRVLLDGRHGWAIGRHGVIVETSDAGGSWRLRWYGRGSQELRSIFRQDGNVVIGGAEAGVVFVTAGGSDALRRVDVALADSDGRTVRGISLTSSGSVAVGDRSLIRPSRTLDGRFQFRGAPPDRGLNDVWVSPAEDSVWIAGDAGTLLHYRVGAAGPEQPAAPAPVDLLAIAFDGTGRLGWAAGRDGTILHSADGGVHWRRQTVGPALFLAAMNGADVPPGEGRWKIAPDGRILHGEPKAPQPDPGTYRRWPAPWYYLTWFAAAAFVARGVRRRSEPEVRPAATADRGMSDRPLTAEDADLLDFDAVALAISRFIRNENTLPPLTVAVTGEWGSGKSSILNRLRADLEEARFRPIFFNAWHHQNDDSLLAALLQAIRTEAIPPWWSAAGIAYRGRLFGARFRRRPVFLTAMVLVLLASLGYLLVVPFDGLLQLAAGIAGLFDPKDKQAAAAGFWQSSPFLAFVASAAALLMAWRDRLGAIGVPPLRQLVGGGLDAATLKNMVGFRHRFAGEFRDVTGALKPSAIVVIIDDLDRCRAENVMRTLELMNFLVSAGDCYLVVGMAPLQVMELIGGQIGDAAKARLYLDKLINVEIPVPGISPAQRLALLKATTPGEDEERAAARQRARARRRTAVAMALVLLGVLAAGSGYLLGRLVAPAAPDLAAAPAATIEAGTTADQGTANGGSTSSADDQPVPPEPAQVLGEGGLHGDASAVLPLVWLVVPLLFVLLAGLVELLRHRPVGVVVDSPAFSAAIDNWAELIGLRTPTPRSAKRFMNRLRYIAMRQRSERETRGTGEALAEPQLVALCALELAGVDLAALGALADSAQAESSATAVAMQKGMDGYIRQTGSWPPSAAVIDRFRELASGVRTAPVAAEAPGGAESAQA